MAGKGEREEGVVEKERETLNKVQKQCLGAPRRCKPGRTCAQAHTNVTGFAKDMVGLGRNHPVTRPPGGPKLASACHTERSGGARGHVS